MQNIKKSTPGIAFTEVGRVLGDKWKKMTGIFFNEFNVSVSSYHFIS